MHFRLLRYLNLLTFYGFILAHTYALSLFIDFLYKIIGFQTPKVDYLATDMWRGMNLNDYGLPLNPFRSLLAKY